MGSGGVGWDNNVHVPVRTLLFHDQLPVGCGGVGQAGTITLTFPCTHRHRNLIIFPALRHKHCSFMISYRWGGVGWGGVARDNNVHGFLCTHRHSNLIIFLAVLHDTGTALS